MILELELPSSLAPASGLNQRRGAIADALDREDQDNAATESSRATTTRSQHRVTDLTLLVSDGLVRRLTQHLLTLALLPLEVAYLRAVARAWLPVARRGEIWEAGVWGGRGRGGAVGYVSAVGLCIGFEAALSVGWWLLESRAILVMGRRWFGWGRL